MPVRIALLCFLLAPIAHGQIQMLLDGAPVRSSVDLGSQPTGDVRDTTFTLVAVGTSQNVTRVTVAGTGFSLPSAPAGPFAVNVGQPVPVVVRFQSTGSGIYSAAFTVNDFSAILRITVVAGLTLTDVTGGTRTLIGNGTKIQFPDTPAGGKVRRSFSLENQSATPLPTPALGLTGASLQLFIDLTAGKIIPPKAVFNFQIEAASDSRNLLGGTLTIGDKRYDIAAQFLEPLLPAAHLVFDANGARSGVQKTVSIVFDDDPAGNTHGELRASFFPSSANITDEGFCFLDNKSHTVSFEVRKGERRAFFGTNPYAILQTGTTTGTAVIDFTVANRAQIDRLYFAPLPVQLDSVIASRGTNTLEVVLTGFDNTRQVGGDLFFTFYDRNGNALPDGVYSRVSLGDNFTNYFRSSTTGGVFELRTVFPVSGDSSAVSAVDVRLANTLAATKTDKITFQ